MTQLTPAHIAESAGLDLSHDAEVQEALKSLIVETVKHATHMMVHGSNDVKAGIMRMMLPAVARTIKSQHEDEELNALKAQMLAMQEAMKDSMPESRGVPGA